VSGIGGFRLVTRRAVRLGRGRGSVAGVLALSVIGPGYGSRRNLKIGTLFLGKLVGLQLPDSGPARTAGSAVVVHWSILARHYQGSSSVSRGTLGLGFGVIRTDRREVADLAPGTAPGQYGVDKGLAPVAMWLVGPGPEAEQLLARRCAALGRRTLMMA